MTSPPSARVGGAGGQRAKGSTARSTLESLRQRLGAGATEALVAALPVSVREAVRVAAPTDDLPYAHLVALWEAAAALVPGEAGSTLPWAEAAGEEAIRSAGLQLYGGILRKDTPRAFLTQSVSLFRLFYAPGDMEVVVEDGPSAVLRLVGFDPVTPLFCARLTGGLRASIRAAGGMEAQAAHVRCTLAGDAFCEWALRWTVPAAAPGGSEPGVLAPRE